MNIIPTTIFSCNVTDCKTCWKAGKFFYSRCLRYSKSRYQQSFGMLKPSHSIRKYASGEIRELLSKHAYDLALLGNDIHIQPIMEKVGWQGHDKFHVTGRELYVKLTKKAETVYEFFKPYSKKYEVNQEDVIKSVTESKEKFKSFIVGREADEYKVGNW